MMGDAAEVAIRYRRAWTLAAAAIFIGFACTASAVADATGGQEGVEFFEKKVRPILADRCYECHSRGSQDLQAKLMVDSLEGMLKGGESGPALVAGDVEKSPLIRAVRYTDEKLQMPPDEKLSDAEIAVLEEWVRIGAPGPRDAARPTSAPAAQSGEAEKLAQGRKHWAFQRPKEHAPPRVKDAEWPKQPLDQFILAKLEEKGLKPAAPADRRTLIRRAYFDLLGVPPPVARVEAFVNDPDPAAYAKLVDELLASPLYGQRWARHWLDVVRYTDSFDARVLGGDQDVAFAWRYRDWVVDAFNRDLPYDQFVMRQVAGDLLPPPPGQRINKDGIVATGVYVMGEWGGGDADKEKLITDIVDDQVDLTGRAFMGLTVACARCHDHKFDPISTKDYYGLAGIFFSTHIIPDPGPKTNGPNNLRVLLLDDQELAARKADEAREARLNQEVEAELDAGYAALAEKMIPRAGEYLAAAWEYSHGAAGTRPSVEHVAKERGLEPYVLRQWAAYLSVPQFNLQANGSRDHKGLAGVRAWQTPDGADTPVVLVNTTEAVVEPLPSLTLPPRSVSMHPSPGAGIAVAWKSPIGGRVSVSGSIVDGHAVCGDGVTWSLSRIGGKSPGELASGSVANGGRQSVGDGTGGSSLGAVDVSAGEFLQLTILPKAEYTCDTTNVELAIEEIGGERRKWDLGRDVAGSEQFANPQADSYGNAGVWHFHDLAGQDQAVFASGSPVSRFTAAVAADPSNVAAAAADVGRALREVAAEVGKARAAGKASAAPAGPDGVFYAALTSPRGPFWSPARAGAEALPADIRDRVAAKRVEVARIRESLAQPIPVTQAMQEGGTPGSMFPGVQDVPVHVRGRYDRLGDVVPRRFPQVIAGETQPPIAKGSGRLELARWLASADHPLTARVMVNRVWQHHFGRGIVATANNFGRLGTPPTHPELLDYLAVQFVRSGWSVKALHRTIMLSATYMQSSEPSREVLAADPDNLLLGRMSRRKLEAEALRDSMLAVAGVLDTVAGGRAVNDLATPRRTLYVMTIRSDRSNYRALFDAADAGAIVERRNDSIVAPQALFLLNHPFVLERAKQLAERAAREGGPTVGGRVGWLYRTLYSRPAEAKEREIARALLDGRAATRPAGERERAWQAYCQVLLCANEFMYVD